MLISQSTTESTDSENVSVGTVLSFITRLNSSVASSRRSAAAVDWQSWLAKYAARIEEEKPLWSESGSEWLQVREDWMKAANPRFVLRQWVLEEVINICQSEPLGRGRSVLNKVLEVSGIVYSLQRGCHSI